MQQHAQVVEAQRRLGMGRPPHLLPDRQGAFVVGPRPVQVALRMQQIAHPTQCPCDLSCIRQTLGDLQGGAGFRDRLRIADVFMKPVCECYVRLVEHRLSGVPIAQQRRDPPA